MRGSRLLSVAATIALSLGCGADAPAAPPPDDEDGGPAVGPDAGDGPVGGRGQPCPGAPVGPVPPALGLDPFYTQYADASGLPVVGSPRVRADAFPVAVEVVDAMLVRRPDLVETMSLGAVRIGIMAAGEVTTDMPEHADLNDAFPETDWDARARGLGATIARPLSSVGEENLLELVDDRWRGESIMVHEFAHTIWIMGVARQSDGVALQTRLDGLYADALAAGILENTYAATNEQEYWAEGVQAWFDTNLEAIPANGIHNEVDTRVELEATDPGLAALIADVLGADDWRPHCVP